MDIVGDFNTAQAMVYWRTLFALSFSLALAKEFFERGKSLRERFVDVTVRTGLWSLVWLLVTTLWWWVREFEVYRGWVGPLGWLDGVIQYYSFWSAFVAGAVGLGVLMVGLALNAALEPKGVIYTVQQPTTVGYISTTQPISQARYSQGTHAIDQQPRPRGRGVATVAPIVPVRRRGRQ